MNQTSYSKRISANDLESIVTRDVNSADEARAMALERLLTVRRAKAGALAREQSRLTAKYGANDPLAIQATARVTANEIVLQGVAVETERARTNIPTVDKSTYAVHGYVYMRDARFKRLANHTVAIYDASGRWMRELGYACTDKQGHFILVVKSDVAKTGMVSDIGGVSERSSLVLHVIDRNNKTIFIDKSQLRLHPGTVEYREIVLGNTAVSRMPPGGGNQPGPKIESASAKVAATRKPRSIKKSKKKGR